MRSMSGKSASEQRDEPLSKFCAVRACPSAVLAACASLCEIRAARAARCRHMSVAVLTLRGVGRRAGARRQPSQTFSGLLVRPVRGAVRDSATSAGGQFDKFAVSLREVRLFSYISILNSRECPMCNQATNSQATSPFPAQAAGARVRSHQAGMYRTPT